ncbi:MAG: PAS domain S-box protein [Gallionella sp.]
MPKSPKHPNITQSTEDSRFEDVPKLPGDVSLQHAGELIHQLQVHQIELEMQNVQLRQTQLELEETRDRHVDFYDFSPVGYLILNLNGLIEDINITGALLLGESREKLRLRRFGQFLLPEDSDTWHHYFRSLSKFKSKQVCELALLRADHSKIWVRMDGIRLEKKGQEPVVRIALTDITDRKMAEAELRKSNYILSKAQRIAHVGSWHYTLSTGVATWSDEMYRIFGVSPDKFTPNIESLLSTIHPDDRASMQSWISDCASGKKPQILEFRIVCPDGSIRILSGYGELQYDADGNPSHLLGMAHDITKQKSAVENLRISHLQSKVFIHDAPLSIAMFDKDMNYLAVSDRWVTEYGRGYTDLVGRNHYDVHPDISDEWKLAHQRGLHGETLKNSDDKWVQADGSEHWLRWAIVPWTDEAGSLGGIIISAEDITESKQAEVQLRLWGDSFDKAEFGLAMADAITNSFISVNPTFARERGYNPEELIGKSIMTIFPDDVVDQVKSMISALDEGSHIVYESMHRCKDGRQFPVLLDITTIKSAEGVPLRRIAYSLDISQRKQAEMARQESDIRYRSLFENMADGFVLFEVVQDEQGVPVDLLILAANQGFETTTGLKATEVTGRRLKEVLPGIESDPANWIGIYTKVALTGEPHRFEQYSDLLGVYFAVSAYQSGPMQCGVTFQNITERKKIEMELKEREARYRAILETTTEGFWVVGKEGRLIEVNESYAKLSGYTREELLCMSIPDLEAKESPQETAARIAKILKTGHDRFETLHRRKDGSVWPVEIAVNYVQEINDLYFAFLIDITERKQAEQELRIAATAFQTQEGILITDTNNVILQVNRAFTEITGYTAGEVIGKDPKLLSSGRQDKYFYRNMWDSINRTGIWNGEIWDKKKNGEIYPQNMTVTAVKDNRGALTNYVATITDNTRRKNDEKLIDNLAYYDPLTGLPNRRLLQDRLGQAIASGVRTGRAGALLFIDLDSFKTINDTLGHDVGDLLLQQVGARIQSCLRDGDTISRPGGDEFVVMLNELNADLIEAAQQAESVAGKILATLEQPYQLNSHQRHVTSSIGVSLFGGQKSSIEDILKQADIAMYQAKNEGKDTIRFFDPRMQDSINARARLENELRTAIEQHQFQLYYQIQKDSSNRPIGAEALIRWIHPERGLVSPVQFIPVAEETGLILPIGEWVLLTACKQIKKWESDELARKLVISVNVSARQLHQTDFVARVKEVVQRVGIDTKHLKLELTESMLVENIEETIAKMQSLKDIGVTLSLDDFGTGYSSLRYLQQLPIDQLKIDQSFVQGIYANKSSQNIVLTIIRMALSMNLEVIAEGVETQKQREFLVQRGCEKFQGYFFGKPTPVDQFEASLMSG